MVEYIDLCALEKMILLLFEKYVYWGLQCTYSELDSHSYGFLMRGQETAAHRESSLSFTQKCSVPDKNFTNSL